MKRSTKVFLGAMGLVTAGWGIERAMEPKLPPCPMGPDGRPIITPQCEDPASSSRSSSSGRSWGSSSSGNTGGGSSWFGGDSSSSHGSGGAGHVTSHGGWGSFGRAFSSGG